MTAQDILRALNDDFRFKIGTEWAVIDELRTGTGYNAGSQSKIDLFAINCYPAKGLKRVAYEIKVSRSDFTRELRKPLKRRVALLYSNQFYFVAPHGVLKTSDIPPEAGLLEVQPNPVEKLRERWPWKVRVTVEAPWRDTPPPSWALFASVARRLTKLQMDAGENQITEAPEDRRLIEAAAAGLAAIQKAEEQR